MREREVKAEVDAAQAIMSDAIRRLAGDVAKLGRRFDEFEQRQIADALRDLPDRDDPEGRSENQQQVEADYLAPAPLPPPLGDEQEAELAIERERGDQGALPAALKAAAPPGNFVIPDPIDDPVAGRGQSVLSRPVYR
jgi:hypothetical protein